MPYSEQLIRDVKKYVDTKKSSAAVGGLKKENSSSMAELTASQILLRCLEDEVLIEPTCLLITAAEQRALRKLTTDVVSKTVASDPASEVTATDVAVSTIETKAANVVMPPASLPPAGETKADGLKQPENTGGSPPPLLPISRASAIFSPEESVWIALHEGQLGDLYQRALKERSDRNFERRVRIKNIFQTRIPNAEIKIDEDEDGFMRITIPITDNKDNTSAFNILGRAQVYFKNGRRDNGFGFYRMVKNKKKQRFNFMTYYLHSKKMVCILTIILSIKQIYSHSKT